MKLYSEDDELRLCLAPNVIRVVKRSVLKCAGHEASMGERRGGYRVLVGKMRETDNSENLSVDRRIISKCIVKK